MGAVFWLSSLMGEAFSSGLLDDLGEGGLSRRRFSDPLTLSVTIFSTSSGSDSGSDSSTDSSEVSAFSSLSRVFLVGAVTFTTSSAPEESESESLDSELLRSALVGLGVGVW